MGDSNHTAAATLITSGQQVVPGAVQVTLCGTGPQRSQPLGEGAQPRSQPLAGQGTQRTQPQGGGGRGHTVAVTLIASGQLQ